MKNNGDMVRFFKDKEYIMLDNDLGGGSFGKTVLLKDPFIDDVFVAKKYEPAFSDEEEKKKFYKNFLEEIKIMYKLNHHNVVRIYNYYAYEDIHTGFIIMEYIDGENIAEWFESCSMGLTTASSNDIFIQLIDAFDYLQKHDVIHRDIREGNILIDKDDNVKVIDFGIGKVILPGDTIKDSLYADINRANSDTLPAEYYNGVYTSLTDMFYLAELINRLLSIYPCSEFMYQHIIDKMMAKQPEERYSSFNEIKKDIEQGAFKSLSITDDEKRIYRDFADSLDYVIGVYGESPTFIFDSSSIISKLETVLTNNMFEDFISNNLDVIQVFVNCKCTYDNEYGISVDKVRAFVEWLKRVSTTKRNIIISNIINKISNKEIDVFAIDPPF